MLRRSRFEPLEPRIVLSTTLGSLADVDDLASGAPFYFALDGFDDEGDTLSYTVEVSGANADNLTAKVLQGNRSLRFDVDGYGIMEFELFEQLEDGVPLAPATTQHYIDLADSGYYNDGADFYRIIDGFMIQGGNPDGGSSRIDDEFHPLLQHTSAGVLATAKSDDDTPTGELYVIDAATRHLDFNHTVFGFLTAGDDVRQAISDLDTNTSQDVPINSVTVFDDTENGVLLLFADSGSLGTATVTVTADDGNGNTAVRSFDVTFTPDLTDNYPFLLPVDPIITTVDTPIEFDIPTYDIDGGTLLFDGVGATDLDLQVDQATGHVVLTPSNGLIGVHSILIGVRPENPADYFEGRDVWDTQSVPVYIAPAPPTSIELLNSSDTGFDQDDLTTKLDNTAGKGLQFRVYGVIPGAQVSLYADGELIGQNEALFEDVVVVTNEDFDLTDGVHSITARQALLDLDVAVWNYVDIIDIMSSASEALGVTVDTSGPVITSLPPLGATPGAQYLYDTQTAEEATAGVVYTLVTSPAGMLINSGSGVVTWTPYTELPDPVSVKVRATDLAGNSTEQEFSLAVGEDNITPTFTSLPPLVAEAGAQYQYNVETTDEPAGNITYSLSISPDGMGIDPDTGLVTWTPGAAQAGENQVVIRATDPADNWSEQGYLLDVSVDLDPPVFTSVAPLVAVAGVPYLYDVQTDEEVAGEVAYSLPTAPAGMAIAADGTITWTPGDGQVGDNIVVVEATDAAGNAAQQQFTVEAAGAPAVDAALGLLIEAVEKAGSGNSSNGGDDNQDGSFDQLDPFAFSAFFGGPSSESGGSGSPGGQFGGSAGFVSVGGNAMFGTQFETGTGSGGGTMQTGPVENPLEPNDANPTQPDESGNPEGVNTSSEPEVGPDESAGSPSREDLARVNDAVIRALTQADQPEPAPQAEGSEEVRQERAVAPMVDEVAGV